MRKKDLYSALTLLIVCGLTYWEASSYPAESSYFPRIIIGLLAILSVFLLGKALLQGREKKTEEPADAPKPAGGLPLWKNRIFVRVLLMICVALIYLVVMSSVGFYLITLFYLPLMMGILGVRRLKIIALSTFSVLFFIYLVFTVFLKVPLPTGILL